MRHCSMKLPYPSHLAHVGTSTITMTSGPSTGTSITTTDHGGSDGNGNVEVGGSEGGFRSNARPLPTISSYSLHPGAKRRVALITVIRRRRRRGRASRRPWHPRTRDINCFPKWAGQKEKVSANRIKASSNLFRLGYVGY